MEAIGIAAVVGIAVTAAWLIYIFKRRSTFAKMSTLTPRFVKSPSGESLNTMSHSEDPTQVAS
jgi:hypothetical protein